ncbi:Cysteine-rich receptor-like protein kinase 8 [Glycine soja]
MVELSKSNTIMPSSKTLLLITNLTLLSFATTEAQNDPFYLYKDCSSDKTSPNTSFQFNLKNLLSSLSSNATGNTPFYNTTINGENPSDSIYGLFMCRADVSSHLCQLCVLNATQQLSSECSLSKQAVIWYEECMVWYSTSSIFSSVATTPSSPMKNSGKVPKPERFMRLVFRTINQTADEASFQSSIGNNKFATKEATNVSGISQTQTLYCLAQCTPNLSPHDCRTCLDDAIRKIQECCEGRIGGRVLFPSCNVRYEMYPFYNVRSATPVPKLIPETKTSHADSNLSEFPIYLSHNCTNKTFNANNSAFQTHLTTLLFNLASNATTGNKFYTADVANTVFGLFLCRDQEDLPSGLCGECVKNATHEISSKCGSFHEAIIWYSQCMLRYSYRNFFNEMETGPVFSELNTTNKDDEQNFFTMKLAKALDQAAIQAGDSDEKYGKRTTKLNDLQTLYALAQCTQNLSIEDCKGCLGIVIGTSIPWSRLGSIGGRVLYPSCNIRFELFQFYKDNDKSGTSSSPGTFQFKKKKRQVANNYLDCCVGKNFNLSIMFHLVGLEMATLESLQFDLATIIAATNRFSDQNKIGKGGFGEVYKGILLDGLQIAVKRLSKSSKQGSNEFKNEVLLIAKLQHRNLVTLIGFCLEEQEKILIYEYVPNKSLDYFLFDSQPQKLSWSQRYNIIGGIIQGILYLHEHSRLKVIHRDLKPSNVLLDECMIPKISDFGLARIVEINQDQGSTKYAMFGQFSEKSDVFSFGVMVLEIISGKKNFSSYESHRITNGLLSYVWKQWSDHTPLNTLDPDITENYSEIEVIKCIQIGLLCVQQDPDARPTMVTVASYLTSHPIELPTPQEPAFFLHGRMDENAVANESSSNQSINTSTPLIFSNNQMSISQFLPR